MCEINTFEDIGLKQCPYCYQGMVIGWENNISDCERCKGSGFIDMTAEEYTLQLQGRAIK